MHHDDAAEKAIFISREHEDESQKLFGHSHSSSSLIARSPSSVEQPSHSLGPSAFPENAASPHSLSVEVMSGTNKSKRPSKIQLAATLRKIRHLLADGYTNKEIIETLQLEERTFYRYMKRIYAQDKAYFEQQDNESIATEIRLAKERTLKSLRRYDAIAADENLSAAERMEAERCRGDIVITLAKIELEGPRIMYETSRRLYDHQYRQQQEQQQLKNGNNIAAAFEPSRQREICSRMMIGQGG
jgi:hypothetical protein